MARPTLGVFGDPGGHQRLQRRGHQVQRHRLELVLAQQGGGFPQRTAGCP